MSRTTARLRCLAAPRRPSAAATARVPPRVGPALLDLPARGAGGLGAPHAPSPSSHTRDPPPHRGGARDRPVARREGPSSRGRGGFRQAASRAPLLCVQSKCWGRTYLGAHKGAGLPPGLAPGFRGGSQRPDCAEAAAAPGRCEGGSDGGCQARDSKPVQLRAARTPRGPAPRN